MAAATPTEFGEIVLGGDLTGDANSPELVSTGVIPGVYGPASRIFVDAKGRVLAAKQLTYPELEPLIATASTTEKGITSPGLNIDLNAALISVKNMSAGVAGVFTLQSPISVTAGAAVVDYDLMPVASTTVKGLAQIGDGLEVSSGVVSRSIGDTTTSSKGVVQPGQNFDVTDGVLSTTFGDATADDLGIVQISAPFEVDGDGTISIPFASSTKKGIVRIGNNLNVSGGVVSAGYGAATFTTPGIVKPGAGLQPLSGTLSLAVATRTTPGIARISTGLSVVDGVVSYDAPDATTTSRGLVQIGSGIDVSGGVISLTVPDATTSSKGLVQIGAGFIEDTSLMQVTVATVARKGIAQAGSGLTVVDGVLSTTIGADHATTTTRGIAQFDSAFFSASAGTISLNTASNTVLGIARPEDTNNIVLVGGALDVGGNIPKLNDVNLMTRANASGLVTSTFSSSWSPDLSLSNTIRMVLGGNITLENPTNAVPGGVYTLILEQGAGGNRTLTISGSAYRTNSTITLSTAAGKIDTLTLICLSSSVIFVIFTPGF